jgi:mono/diheme cytochrome c family protein
MGYGSSLLMIQSPNAPDTARMQFKLLPDRNYGAAIALGLGLMDDSVSNGTTYVYEVWGLDTLGLRQERLGRATATAGSPDPLPAVAASACVDPGDATGNMVALLRWEESLAARERYVTGYDLWRAPMDAAGDCTTTPNGPGAASSVLANKYPTHVDAPGRVNEGRALFQNECTTCHQAANPRATPPSLIFMNSGVEKGNIEEFRRLQHAALVPVAHHDTPGLRALSPESMQSVFSWIQEFHFADDFSDTPNDPPVEGQSYCYRVLARDSLGQYGNAPAADQECVVLDRYGPSAPGAMLSVLVDTGADYEICEISWQRNADAGDDTTEYRLYRKSTVPRASIDPAKREPEPDPATDPPLATIPQPGAGDRITYQDTTQTIMDAGEPSFYSAVAMDDAGNFSGFSSWVPCVPRDIVAPPTPVLEAMCCEDGGDCQDKTFDSNWTSIGGDNVIVSDPNACPVTVTSPLPGDAFGTRLYRSFDNLTYVPGVDSDGMHVETFAPLVDSRIWVAGKDFDRSGNFSVQSAPVSWIIVGLNRLPPPRVVSVTLLPGLPEHIRIRFRSLAPENLLGFALYKHVIETTDSTPTTLGDFVVRYHDTNLSTEQTVVSPASGEWAVKPGAQHLGMLLPNSEPAGDAWLYYDDVDGVYVMQVNTGDTEGLVLDLVAIGWSGREGQYAPYRYAGAANDGMLEWPSQRTTNSILFELQSDNLVASWNAGDQANDLTWTAAPDGCTEDALRPFVVFRKRGNATRWQQVSPPFRCDGGNTAMIYKDRDVEPGLNYTYQVIRLGPGGEFQAEFGPQTVMVP